MSNHNFSNVAIIAGGTNQKLAKEIADFLGVGLTQMKIDQLSDGEIDIKINNDQDIRGKHVYLIQSSCPPVNENIMQIALVSGWLKRNNAKTVTVIMPYYGYSRYQQSRLSSEASQILQSMPIDRFMTLDVHAGQTLGYYRDIIFENLEAQIVPLNYFLNLYDENKEDFVIVSADQNGVSRAKIFCDLFNAKAEANCQLAMLLNYAGDQQTVVLGDVKDKNVIIIDNIIDTASTLQRNCQSLKQHGAKKIYAYATHSIFSGNAFQNINKSQVDQVITTDTIPAQEEEKGNKKILRLTIAPLLAEALRRVVHNLSLENMVASHYDKNHEKIKDKKITT
ncbi:hypothetical protein PPERSA_10828 [Pseudocohnilembus persalinus]|uniref:ribose-phosphate diphosphokinase n=1 Tax=Pseudocohnilembus persalinus TaxID=266149 RepID=A0A0V0QDQ5_PSEPJ|nr:hypothetical protein PPERSA_10828 [Pseudocohnilembus persalinus]|eukprot:KRX00329.1 hypothetical protein PPERSA_10828 [Pseudocohnilembus persalinus]